MEKSVERTQRTVIRFSFGILLGIVLLIAAIWGGHDLYQRWQEKRLVRLAMSDMERGDLRDASLAGRAILEMKPTSAAGARIMAQLAESLGERSALDWRRKVMQAAPDSVEDTLALVRSAVHFNDIATAERTLTGLNENARQSAEYHEAAAMIAQAKHQDEKAEAEWSEALRLNSNKRSFQLQLAVSQLRSSYKEKRVQGEATLNKLRSDPDQRAPATRALINAGITRKEDPRKLTQLARELQTYPEATWNDRIVYLGFLRNLQDPEFSAYLTELEKIASNKPTPLALLLSWMTGNNLSLLALDYAKNLSQESLRNWPVPLAIAGAYVRLRDWKNLETSTSKANWGKFDFLRHVYLARALREQGKSLDAEQEWNAAIKNATTSESLVDLIETISEWHWENEMADLLWALSKQPGKQTEALVALYRHYTTTADTQGLYRVLVRLAALDSNNLNVQNNLAQVSLLLNVSPDEARREAAEVYRKAPTNPAYITTYAYSLLTQGNAKEALRLMSSLPETQLNEPNISAYYGLFLAANGDEKARSYLDHGKQANLLPEEKALIDKAYASLNSKKRAH